jgi:uncharacterized protein
LKRFTESWDEMETHMEWSANYLRVPGEKRTGASAKISKGVLVWLLLTTATSALAAPQLLSQMFKAAAREDPAFDAEDARLNAAYKALAASLDDRKRTALRDEERNWIRGRERQCAKGKNYCTRIHTANRADELERRMGGFAAMSGEWGYDTDCDFGHHTEWNIPKSGDGPITGDWTDVTRARGWIGKFKGEWRRGRLYVRFCEEDDGFGSPPFCPEFGDVDGYLSVRGERLVWFRRSGPAGSGTFHEYVTLSRRPRYGNVSKDNYCGDDDD